MNLRQLKFLPPIDEDRTKENVEVALEKCRLYEEIGFHPEYEPKFAHTYSLAPSFGTNAIHSSTEDVARKNVDTEMERREHVSRVRKAVSRLSRIEREIIEKRYLEDAYVTDYMVYTEMHMSERTYYRIKTRAFYKLAFSLRLEVIKEE
jgi:ArpU family phage transcriptional regulator